MRRADPQNFAANLRLEFPVAPHISRHPQLSQLRQPLATGLLCRFPYPVQNPLDFFSVDRWTPLGALALAAVLIPVSSHAQLIDWSGGGGPGDQDWTSGANWTGGNPPLTTQGANLANVANQIINIDGPQTATLLDSATGANFQIGGSLLTLTAATALVARGTSSMTFNNAVHFGASSASMDVQTGGTPSITFNGAVTSAGDILSNLRNVPAGTIAFNNNVNVNSGAGTLNLRGEYNYILAGTNSFNTLRFDRGGTVKLSSDGAITAGSTLNFQGGNLARVLKIEAVGGPRSYNANLDLNTNALNSGKTVFEGSNNITFTGTTTISRNAAIEVASGMRVSLTGNLAGNLDNFVTKDGEGTLALGSGGTTTFIYRNGTTVNAGTLLINGDMGNVTGSTDIVTVNSGGTLGGTGIIRRETTANSGGIIAPGDEGIGSLRLDGASITALTMASGSVFNFELDASGGTPDRIDLWNYTGGDLALNSNVINFDLLGVVNADTYTVDLFRFFSDAGSTLTASGIASGLTLGTLGAGIDSANIIYGTDVISLQYTVIPEPATSALLAASLVALCLSRRRRRVA